MDEMKNDSLLDRLSFLKRLFYFYQHGQHTRDRRERRKQEVSHLVYRSCNIIIIDNHWKIFSVISRIIKGEVKYESYRDLDYSGCHEIESNICLFVCLFVFLHTKTVTLMGYR